MSTVHRPLRILVLGGGPSPEREVSLESAAAVARALVGGGHCVTTFDPVSRSLAGISRHVYDVAFIALHGEYGEDGQVQRQLDELGIPYTGSDSVASAMAISKSATKRRIQPAGVPTPDWALIDQASHAEEIETLVQRIDYPLVIKPDTAGSSLGVTIVRTPEALPAALSRCFHYDTVGLIEAAIVGTEWTVGLIDDVALPPIQIVSASEFYDYDAKYKSDDTQYLFETDAPPFLREQLQQLARKSAAALGTTGIVRVDFRVDKFNRPWVLEVNTIPGMTSHSLIPKGAERIGISFQEVCERALASALAREAMKCPQAA